MSQGDVSKITVRNGNEPVSSFSNIKVGGVDPKRGSVGSFLKMENCITNMDYTRWKIWGERFARE